MFRADFLTVIVILEHIPMIREAVRGSEGDIRDVRDRVKMPVLAWFRTVQYPNIMGRAMDISHHCCWGRSGAAPQSEAKDLFSNIQMLDHTCQKRALHAP